MIECKEVSSERRFCGDFAARVLSTAGPKSVYLHRFRCGRGGLRGECELHGDQQHRVFGAAVESALRLRRKGKFIESKLFQTWVISVAFSTRTTCAITTMCGGSSCRSSCTRTSCIWLPIWCRNSSSARCSKPPLDSETSLFFIFSLGNDCSHFTVGLEEYCSPRLFLITPVSALLRAFSA